VQIVLQFLSAALIRCITVPHILRKGLHNSQAPGRNATKLCTVVPNIFSIITLVFFSHKNACQFTCAPSTKHQITLKFTGHPGSQFTPELWILSMELDSYEPAGAQNLEVAP
jgi:hypothetical protein